MNGRRPLIWVLVALWAAAQAAATPIRPNVQKLLSESPEPAAKFAPARAGWQGPETPQASQPAPNSPLEVYGQAASARAVRASLRAAVIPDPRAVFGILALILLLRTLRKRDQARRRTQTATEPAREIQLRPAA